MLSYYFFHLHLRRVRHFFIILFFTMLLQNLLCDYIDVETCEGHDHYVNMISVLWTERVLDVVVWDLRGVDGIVVDMEHVDVVISKKQGVDVAARVLGSVDMRVGSGSRER